MCGIVGIFGGAPQQFELEAMLDTIRHRGPDDEGFYCDDQLGLGHVRLSIVDLSAAGSQPMVSPDGRYVLVYNGEIYNHLDFRLWLEQQGVVFRGHSDTETLLWLLILKGTICLPELNGIFAFAFFDTQEHRLLLARDQMGVKPLYYTQGRENRFLFASEIKVLFSTGEVTPRLNIEDLVELLMFHFIAGERTAFSGVYELLPGHYMHLTPQKRIIQRYWSLLPDSLDQLADYKGVVKKTRELLSSGVDRQLMSDVPLGLMLSGGIDSGSVAALAMATGQPHTIKGYCFRDPDHHYDEFQNARAIAQRYNIDLKSVHISEHDIPSLIIELTRYYDEPLPRPHNLAAYAVAKAAHDDDIKVLLTGEGGDEIFGGYHRYIKLGNEMAANGDMSGLVFSNNRAALPRIAKFWNQERFNNGYRFWVAQETAPYDLINRQLFVDQQTFLQHFLQRSDRMGMAASLENRVPFLDIDLVTFINRQPGTHKISGGRTKACLRDAVQHLLPERVYNAAKQPFDMPMETFIREGVVSEFVEEMLLNRPRSSVIFEGKGIQHLLTTVKSGDAHSWKSVWMLLTFEVWLREFCVSI